MVSPNFFIVGAPKCGTTSLADWLREHPEVFITKQKEPHYFNKDHNFNVYKSYDDYMGLFSNAEGFKAVGEASVWYLYSNVAVDNIENSYKKPKYIVCLRDPTEMAHSLYWEQVYATNEHVKTFIEAWKLSPQRRKGEAVQGGCREPKHLDYMHACRLGYQVERLLEKVRSDRVFFVFLDDLKRNPENVYLQLQKFLDVSPYEIPDYQPSNTFKKVRWRSLKKIVRYLSVLKKKLPIKKRFGILNYLNSVNKKSSEKPVVDEKFEKVMRQYFRDDVRKLAKLTNRDLTAWLE